VSIPSVSLGLNDHYSPELRDEILGKLRAATNESTYSLLTPVRLRALVDMVSSDAPVLSLYLQLSPERRAHRAWQTAFSSLSFAVLKRVEDRHQRDAIKDELDRIESTLDAELPVLGRGVVFFAGQAIPLWRQIAVSVPLPDGAYFGTRPYVRPLVRTRDEHDRFILALLSLEHSRFFISQIGQVEEVFQVRSDGLRRAVGERVALTNREDVMLEAIRNQGRVLAHIAELVLAQFEGRYLLVAGTPELRADFIESLSKDGRQRVGAAFAVELHAGPREVAAAAEAGQRAIEEREEIATVQRLIEAGPNGSAWGESQTFEALREGRVMTLAADDLFGKPGAWCRECGGLSEVSSPDCPACGSKVISTVEDVVEMAIEQALDQRAALELVRSGAARRMMIERAPIAALLRW
jgi:peptide subunit release factor 1 (eRF1)